MSSDTKRPLGEARVCAASLRNLIPPAAYERWEVAGSVRRGRPMVGDIEHVIIPRFSGERNLLWEAVESLTHDPDSMFADESAPLRKATYQNGTHRWGDKYRGVLFGGFKHELFTATPDGWGCILAIRTGPAEFSQMLVTKLHGTRLRQRDGVLVYADGGAVYPCPDERTFFAACGVEWAEPKDRDPQQQEAR